MTIAHVDRLSARLFFDDGYLVVPESVNCRLALPVDLVKIAHDNKSAKEDLRILHRRALNSEISHAESDFETFYTTMYIPYVQKRHGEFAVVHSLHRLRRAFRRGGLIWVTRDDRRIAGGVFEQRRDVLKWVALGTAQGDLTLLKQGALAALYVFHIRCAEARGCTSIDFGGTPPILNDGLLRFKKKWGAELESRPQTPYDYLLRWEHTNEAIRTFLAETPLVCRNDRGLVGVTALKPQDPSPDGPSRMHHSLWMKGIHQLRILTDPGYGPQFREPPGIHLVDRWCFDQLTR
jgi:hypothetical protein